MNLCLPLRHLSDEHARLLEVGERRKGEDTASLAARLLALWDGEILPHCRGEEEVLLPELVRHISEADAVVVFTQGDHTVLRRLARELRLAERHSQDEAVTRLMEKLAEHFRFEEQTLFPALQATLGCDCLAALGGEMAAFARTGTKPPFRSRSVPAGRR